MVGWNALVAVTSHTGLFQNNVPVKRATMKATAHVSLAIIIV
jgi:hypothetical protein